MAVPRQKIPQKIDEYNVGQKKKWFSWDVVGPLILLGCACIIWYIAGNRSTNYMILPRFQDVAGSFLECLTSAKVHKNLLITLKRVFTGFGYAFIIGTPIGLIMGYSKTANSILAPFVHAARQVPIMAWVPLSIIWFGLGDGPTVFLIAFSGVFTVLINTISSVHDIDVSYYNASRSLGAGNFEVIRDVVLPGSFPGIFTGARMALGAGWMSVI